MVDLQVCAPLMTYHSKIGSIHQLCTLCKCVAMQKLYHHAWEYLDIYSFCIQHQDYLWTFAMEYLFIFICKFQFFMVSFDMRDNTKNVQFTFLLLSFIFIFFLIEVAWNSATKYFYLSIYLMHWYLSILFFLIVLFLSMY